MSGLDLRMGGEKRQIATHRLTAAAHREMIVPGGLRPYTKPVDAPVSSSVPHPEFFLRAGHRSSAQFLEQNTLPRWDGLGEGRFLGLEYHAHCETRRHHGVVRAAHDRAYQPSQVESISYGQEAHRRVGDIVALSLVLGPFALFGLLNHSTDNLVGIVYHTDDGKRGAILLETPFYWGILQVLKT